MGDLPERTVDAAEVVVELRIRTDLTLYEIGEIVGMSAAWCRRVEQERTGE